ncbi:DegT/DnrJ/EryC1/StrS family aminotransferase [Kitasatospora sp. NPDC097643]|uniref:DegT/DnrJ/EryC1/StrS family aminotransferase n=1 Tax=Kitasatospora sp. NPDC097643 TaxID=3157230 RepID=UPI0033340A27
MSGPGHSLIGEAERANVLRALEGTLTRYRYGQPGEPSFVHRFERAVEDTFDARHCIATNSGTSALLSGLAALGIGPGDEVLVPGYTFIASVASIVHAGATPVLVEIDDTLNIDPVDAASKITPRTRAILPVHMLGAGADMDAIGDLAAQHGLAVLEDVAQACGGSHRGRRLGTIGDVGAFSLNYFKVITAGEGGFLLTGSRELYERAYSFHDHGFKPLRDGAIDADSLFGLNLRMGDLAGAVAFAQLGRLEDVLNRTRSRKAALVSAIGDLPGVRRRRLVDPAGDCATTVVYLFEDTDAARRVAARLGTTTLVDSGRHYYGNMPQLLSLGAGDRTSSTFHRRDQRAMPDYSPGSLPRTDDLLARAVAVSTGAADSYSATNFGVDVHSSDKEVELAAERFRAAVLSGASR